MSQPFDPSNPPSNSSAQQPAQRQGAYSASPQPAFTPDAYPLLPGDPPKIGDFWLDARLGARPSGIAYLAHADNQPPVMLIVLSAGAAGDAAARDRLAGEVNKMHVDTVVARGGEGQDEGRLGGKFRNEDDDPIGPDDAPLAPWVALAWDGSRNAIAEADRLLRSVDLSSTPTIGRAAGPDYRLHWLDRTQAGPWRLWPLSWPGRRDRAGWMTLFVSWLLTVLLATLALLIVVLLFQPQGGGGGGGGGGDSSNSQSQSQSGGGSGSQSQSQSQSQSGSGSGSASQSQSGSQSGSQSASPSSWGSSPGQGGSPTKTPSMEVSGSGTNSATATPSRNTKL